MREIKVTKYEAPDGKLFDEPQGCLDYEAANPDIQLIGLSAQDIYAAMAGTNMRLAAAILQVSDRIGRDARQRGAAAFLAGRGGIVPDDLRADMVASEEWLAGWDAESVKRRTAA